MGLKFFNAKLSFKELKVILEINSSFGVETAFFQNCLVTLVVCQWLVVAVDDFIGIAKKALQK